MPLIALDEVGRLIQKQHPRLPFLLKDVTEVMPKITHPLFKSLGVKALWQVVTFSEREFDQELDQLGFPLGSEVRLLVISAIKDTMLNHGLGIRETYPFALRVFGDPARFIKVITDSSNTLVTFYQDATYYWTRWTALGAVTRFSAAFPKLQIVFRSETLKLGHTLLVP